MLPWRVTMHRIPTLFALVFLYIHASTAVPQVGDALSATASSPFASGSAGVLTRRDTYNCKESWMSAIEAQAWADAGALAKEAYNWRPNGQWQDAMTLYMGANCAASNNKNKVYSGLQNELDVHQKNRLFPESRIKTYCGDSVDMDENNKAGSICRQVRRGKVVYPFATSWVNRGTFYNDYYIILCPRFFAEKDSLYHILAKMNTGIIDKSNGSAYKWAWGHTYYHELMHLDPLVAPGDTSDPAYYACNAASLAAGPGCNAGYWNGYSQVSSLINPDSWSFFADSTYYQKAWNLKSPGKPDCGADNAKLDSDLESFWYPDTNRTDGTFSLGGPPPDPSATSPAPDGPTPALPFDPNAPAPAGLATPYTDAIAYWQSLQPPEYSTEALVVPFPTQAVAPTTPTASPVNPPYATGTCHIHLKEYQVCGPDSSNLFAVVNMYDNAGNDIGDIPVDETKNPVGDPINDADPYSFTSKLPNPLIIIGEHENDYIQFTLGSLSWTSRTTTGPATCKNGGWDPRDGPICGQRFGNQNAMNQMDCWFPC